VVVATRIESGLGFAGFDFCTLPYANCFGFVLFAGIASKSYFLKFICKINYLCIKVFPSSGNQVETLREFYATSAIKFLKM
jgi:hypothetical protein